MTDVEPLEDGNAFVLAQLPVELAVADVDSSDRSGAPLQEAVGEPSGRGPGIERVAPRYVDAERVEGMAELQPP